MFDQCLSCPQLLLVLFFELKRILRLFQLALVLAIFFFHIDLVKVCPFKLFLEPLYLGFDSVMLPLSLSNLLLSFFDLLQMPLHDLCAVIVLLTLFDPMPDWIVNLGYILRHHAHVMNLVGFTILFKKQDLVIDFVLIRLCLGKFSQQFLALFVGLLLQLVLQHVF